MTVFFRLLRRNRIVIELEQLPDDLKVDSQFYKGGNTRGVIVAVAIIGIWVASLLLLLLVDISKVNLLFILAAIVWQTFFCTGLFITAHDAMHGAVFRNNLKINHFIGTVSLILYGCLSYKSLLKKHWLHHHHPASELDPDFHDGQHKSFFPWYFHFMKNYWSWGQIIALTIIYNSVYYILHISRLDLALFWGIPSVLSSLQLFYYGTFLPHKEPENGYSEPSRAETISRPVWWSFITCYHFGYHREHHEYPHAPWWQLPRYYQKSELQTLSITAYKNN
jgi:beta-carotene ketolase (CrtW type)